jgi:hypothetical protein
MKWTQNSSQKLFLRCSKGLSKNTFNDAKQQVKYDWEQDTIMVRSGLKDYRYNKQVALRKLASVCAAAPQSYNCHA